MPEHTSFFTYLAYLLPATWDTNLSNLHTLREHHPLSRGALEPILAAAIITLIVMILAILARVRMSKIENVIVPSDKLSVFTFMEIFVGYFYSATIDIMGSKRAKRFFPLIGTCATFIFVSNILSLIPGVTPPTSSLNVTFACGIIVFIAYHTYGFREHGIKYLLHFCGPVWWLAPLIIPIELMSHCIRPCSLALRLMLNMSVDHLTLGIFIGLFPLIVPVPIMVLGTVIALVQTLVFSLLASVYVSMATEHDH